MKNLWLFTFVLIFLLTMTPMAQSEIPLTLTVTDEVGDVDISIIDIDSSSYIKGSDLIVSTYYTDVPVLNSSIRYDFNLQLFDPEGDRFAGISIDVVNNKTSAQVQWDQNTTSPQTLSDVYVDTHLNNQTLIWEVDYGEMDPDSIFGTDHNATELEYEVTTSFTTSSGTVEDTLYYYSKSDSNTEPLISSFTSYIAILIGVAIIPIYRRFRKSNQ